MSDLRAKMSHMTTIGRLPRARTVRVVTSSLMCGTVLGLMCAAGHTIIPALADRIGPGAWGYLGTVGVLTALGLAPFMLVTRRPPVRIAVLTATATLAVAHLGGARHWPEQAALYWCVALAVGWVAWRAARYLPVLLTMRRAERLLRRHRSTGEGRVWSARDWEWAYTHLGTPLALDFASKFRRLQSVTPDHPDHRT